MRKELATGIGLILVFIASIVFAEDLIIAVSYGDRLRDTFSCGYLKNTIKRKGDIVDVQIDRIGPKRTVRTWISNI